MPGRPRDVVGLKAMAIFAQRAFWTLRPGGVKVHAGAPVIECEHGRGRLQGIGRGRRQAARRSRIGRRQGRADCAEDGRLGAQVRHPEHDPHRRSLDSRLRPDRQGRGAGSRHRRGRPYQWRPHRPARRPDPLHLRGLQARAGAGSQRQRALGAVHAAHRARDGRPRPRHPRHRRAGRLRRAAARHPADGVDAVLARRPARRDSPSAWPPATPPACASSIAASSKSAAPPISS